MTEPQSPAPAAAERSSRSAPAPREPAAPVDPVRPARADAARPRSEMPRPDLGYGARRAIAAAAMLVALAIGLPRFLTHTPYQRFGVTPDWTAGGDHVAIGEVFAPPGQGVFHKGDRL